MRFAERLKQRWGVGPLGVLAILIAFALAGSTVVALKKPVIGFLLPEGSPNWLRWVVYLLIIMPLYHALLFAYGTLLGQYRFFRAKSAATGRWLAGLARRRRSG